jgi:hypothetical protein
MENKNKIEFSFFLEKEYKIKINSRRIVNAKTIIKIIDDFLKNYKNKKIKLIIKDKTEWTKQYVTLRGEDIDKWEKFKEIAHNNKISATLLLRILINEYVQNKIDEKKE